MFAFNVKPTFIVYIGYICEISFVTQLLSTLKEFFSLVSRQGKKMYIKSRILYFRREIKYVLTKKSRYNTVQKKNPLIDSRIGLIVHIRAYSV